MSKNIQVLHSPLPLTKFSLDVNCFELHVSKHNNVMLLLYYEEYDGATLLAVTACVKLNLHKGIEESQVKT